MALEKPQPFRLVRLRLEALGFRGIVQTANHAKFVKTAGGHTQTAILPHYQELTVSVIRSIARQAEVPESALLGD